MLFQSTTRLKIQIKLKTATWFTQLDQACTLNQLKMLLYAFEQNLKWTVSDENLGCALCNTCKAAEEKNNDEKLFVKEKCSKCFTCYHLHCLLEHVQKRSRGEMIEKQQENEAEMIDLEREFESKIQGFGLFKEAHSYSCFDCSKQKKFLVDLARQEFDEQEKHKRRNDAQEMNDLNSIEINQRALRFNKTRAQM